MVGRSRRRWPFAHVGWLEKFSVSPFLHQGTYADARWTVCDSHEMGCFRSHWSLWGLSGDTWDASKSRSRTRTNVFWLKLSSRPVSSLSMILSLLELLLAVYGIMSLIWNNHIKSNSQVHCMLFGVISECWPFRYVDVAPSWASNLRNPVRETASGHPVFTLRVMPWSDDVSGNVSKSYNAHMNVYVANVNIPHKKLYQEYFVRFCSTSPDVSSSEQFDALAEDLWVFCTINIHYPLLNCSDTAALVFFMKPMIAFWKGKFFFVFFLTRVLPTILNKPKPPRRQVPKPIIHAVLIPMEVQLNITKLTKGIMHISLYVYSFLTFASLISHVHPWSHTSEARDSTNSRGNTFYNQRTDKGCLPRCPDSRHSNPDNDGCQG